MPVFTKDGRSVLFIHVPKTGGTAIEETFLSSGWDMTYRDVSTAPRSPNWYRRCSPQHMHGTLLDAVFRLDRFAGIFMVVREPLARFRSEYAMRTKSAALVGTADVALWADKVLDQYAEDSYVWDNHLRPQSEYLVPRVQVFRLEAGLGSAVTWLNDAWSLDLSPSVPRARDRLLESGYESCTVQLSSRLEGRLREFYRPDFEAFGY